MPKQPKGGGAVPHSVLHERDFGALCTGWDDRLPKAEDGAAFPDDGNSGAMDGPEAVDDGVLTMGGR